MEAQQTFLHSQINENTQGPPPLKDTKEKNNKPFMLSQHNQKQKMEPCAAFSNDNDNMDDNVSVEDMTIRSLNDLLGNAYIVLKYFNDNMARLTCTNFFLLP